MAIPGTELEQTPSIDVESRLARLEERTAYLQREVTALQLTTFELKLAVCFIFTVLVLVPCAYALAKVLK